MKNHSHMILIGRQTRRIKELEYRYIWDCGNLKQEVAILKMRIQKDSWFRRLFCRLVDNVADGMAKFIVRQYEEKGK